MNPTNHSFPQIRFREAGAVIAWIVILAMVAIVLFGTAEEPDGPQKDRAGLQENLMARYAYGVRGMPGADVNQVLGQMQEAAKLQGAGERFRLELLKSAFSESPPDEEVLAALVTESPELGEPAKLAIELGAGREQSKSATKKFLERHGWAAKAFVSKGRPETDPMVKEVARESQRTFIALMLAGVGILVLGLAGVVLFIIFVVKWRKGEFPFVWQGLPIDRGGPFVEAFAIYLLGMVLPSMLAEHFEGVSKYVFVPLPLGLLILALYWPRFRGIAKVEWKYALGLSTGRGFFKESLMGVLGWITALPVIALGVFISVILSSIGDAPMNHPIEDIVGNPRFALIAFLLAAVYAPITEELTFRGLLLAGLRARWAFWVAAAASSLIFAAVHPQGWAAIPVLASIALCLAFLRGWRGNMVAPMAAHAIHNGLLVSMMVLATG